MAPAVHRSRARHARWASLAAAVLALTVACSGSSAGHGSFADGKGGGGAESAPVAIKVQPAANAANVPPGTPVVVTASGGTLSAVQVSTAGGAEVGGALNAGKTSWTSKDKLAFGADYRVSVTATNPAGKTTTTSSSFTTVTAKAEAFPAVSPLRGTVMGVGMPIRVYFDAPVADQDGAVKHMTVTTSMPTEGAWHWFSDREVHWRPKEYWKAGSDVALDISLFGVDLGDGVWGGGEADRHIDFSIGPSHVSVADTRTHQMKVYASGRLVRTLPVSMGKEVPGRYTKGGPHVVIDKNRVKKMDSRTYGLALDAGGYTAKVEWATRISNNGEFVHSAPWSVEQQGKENVSHGCINVSPANAQWFFNFSKIGDVVEVVGSPVKLSAKDGDIWDWAIPWSTWTQG